MEFFFLPPMKAFAIMAPRALGYLSFFFSSTSECALSPASEMLCKLFSREETTGDFYPVSLLTDIYL